MTEIISRPALKNGVVIEKELVEQLLEQIKDVDGSLPILQFTLDRIWNKESISDRCISSTEFNKLSEGKGVSGIIETHAENVINSITNKGQNKDKEDILKTIFVNLVEVNENLNDVKRTVSKAELYSILKLHPEQVVNEVFETLVSEKSRLLNISQDKDETINVGIIHEELIRKWERLKDWINNRREGLEQKKKILQDIKAFNKGEENLYNRKKLKRARTWLTNNPDLTNDEINSFIDQSRLKSKKRLFKNSIMLITSIAVVFFLIVKIALPIAESVAKNRIIDNLWSQANKSDNANGYIEFLLNEDVSWDNQFISEAIKIMHSDSLPCYEGWIFYGTKTKESDFEVIWRRSSESAEENSELSLPKKNDVIRNSTSYARIMYKNYSFDSQKQEFEWRPTTKAFVIDVKYNDNECWVRIKYN
jgi:hypothetical protein